MTLHNAEKTNHRTIIFAAFAKLSAAFNHINQEWLFQLIRNRISETKKYQKFYSNSIISFLKDYVVFEKTQDSKTLDYVSSTPSFSVA